MPASRAVPDPCDSTRADRYMADFSSLSPRVRSWLSRQFPALGDEVEDVMQSVAELLWRFGSQGGEIGNLQGWLYKVAFRCARRMRPDKTDVILVQLPDAEVSDPAIVADQDGLLDLRAALRRLSPEEREIIRLHIFDGLTFEAIASRNGNSAATWFRRYRSAVGRLQKELTPGPLP